MGNNTSLSSSQALSSVNNVLQVSQSKCSVECDQTSTGNVVVIGNGSTVGNIDFSQTCVITNSSCMIKQSIEANVTNILKSIAEQSTFSTQPLFSASFSGTQQSATIEQDVYNSITQLISSTCTFDTNQTMTNNYVYVGNGSTTGDISFAQNSEISSVECSLDVAAKSSLYNSLTSETSQSAITIDPLSLLAICFVAVLGMGFFLVLVFLFKGGSSGGAPPKQQQPIVINTYDPNANNTVDGNKTTTSSRKAPQVPPKPTSLKVPTK